MPIFSVSKYLYERNRLEQSKNIFQYGLKRMWKILKINGKVRSIDYFYDDLYDSKTDDFDNFDAADLEINHNEL
jgi:hypothetical protein